MKEKCSKHGFTLVELSIVLVIIGLLIGGILVAQSMIRTAKVQSFIKQVQQIDVAVSNFKTKYNQLPGDSTYFGGDGNGSIGAGVNNYDAEKREFFLNIQQDGFDGQGKTFIDTIATNFDVDSATPNSPKTSLGTKGGYIAYTNSGKSYIEAAGWTSVTSSYSLSSKPGQGYLDGIDAAAIDTKMDDGIGNKGIVQGMGPFAMDNLTGPCDDYTATGKYSMGNGNCSLRFDLQSANY